MNRQVHCPDSQNCQITDQPFVTVRRYERDPVSRRDSQSTESYSRSYDILSQIMPRAMDNAAVATKPHRRLMRLPADIVDEHIYKRRLSSFAVHGRPAVKMVSLIDIKLAVC
jgi:hypothetical protein